jgi:hypothetical protein
MENKLQESMNKQISIISEELERKHKYKEDEITDKIRDLNN